MEDDQHDHVLKNCLIDCVFDTQDLFSYFDKFRANVIGKDFNKPISSLEKTQDLGHEDLITIYFHLRKFCFEYSSQNFSNPSEEGSKMLRALLFDLKNLPSTENIEYIKKLIKKGIKRTIEVNKIIKKIEM